MQALPGSLAYARDLALVSQLAEADTADAVVPEIGVGTTAQLAAVVLPGGELGLSLLLQDHGFLSHNFSSFLEFQIIIFDECVTNRKYKYNTQTQNNTDCSCVSRITIRHRITSSENLQIHVLYRYDRCLICRYG